MARGLCIHFMDSLEAWPSWPIEIELGLKSCFHSRHFQGHNNVENVQILFLLCTLDDFTVILLFHV